jgi:hypothetical protein
MRQRQFPRVCRSCQAPMLVISGGGPGYVPRPAQSREAS